MPNDGDVILGPRCECASLLVLIGTESALFIFEEHEVVFGRGHLLPAPSVVVLGLVETGQIDSPVTGKRID